MPANPVFFKSGQVNSRPATKFYPYRIIEPTVLDCTKLPGHPPMYLRKVSHHTECFLTKLGPYAHTKKNIQAGVVTEFAHLKGTRLALVTSLN